MPNTEVKLLRAESSWWETTREDRELPRCYYSGLAQLVEHLTVNQVVVSSSLTTGVFFYLGELSEWLKEHDWKSCIRVLTCIRGSNPLLSVWINVLKCINVYVSVKRPLYQ